MPRFLLGSNTWAKHRCQLFSLLNPHNAVWVAPKTLLQFPLWLFHIYCRNVFLLSDSITRTLEELNCSWTTYTNLISDVPSHFIYSSIANICACLKQRCHWVQKQENNDGLNNDGLKTWGFGLHGTLLITDFGKEWSFHWKFTVFSAMSRRLLIPSDINNYTKKEKHRFFLLFYFVWATQPRKIMILHRRWLLKINGNNGKCWKYNVYLSFSWRNNLVRLFHNCSSFYTPLPPALTYYIGEENARIFQPEAQ